MKFLHIADLHLGKKPFNYDVDEEHRAALQQVLDAADKHDVDGVLIAGDVYDTVYPPVSAVNTLNWFLEELHKRNLQVMMIYGNHDSASRLSFGNGLLSSANIHISSPYAGDVEYADLEKDGEKVRVHLLPFIKPAVVRAAHQLDHDSCATWNDAMRIAMEHVHLLEDGVNVLVSHQFYTGGSMGESEVRITGTLDEVSTEFLEPFDYAALGHLHKPQFVGKEIYRYPGTLLKYAVPEFNTTKSFTLIETHPDHTVDITPIDVVPLRDFVRIEGTLRELLSPEFYEKQNPDNYFYAVLDDQQEVFRAFEDLSEFYPRLLGFNYSWTDQARNIEMDEEVQAVSDLSPMEKITKFFAQQMGRETSDAELALISEVWEAVHETD